MSKKISDVMKEFQMSPVIRWVCCDVREPVGLSRVVKVDLVQVQIHWRIKRMIVSGLLLFRVSCEELV